MSEQFGKMCDLIAGAFNKHGSFLDCASAVFEWHESEVEKLKAENARMREKLSEMDAVRKVLEGSLDRDKEKTKDLSILMVANIVSNGIFWRDRKIENLNAENARLREALETIRLGGENREYVHMPRACLAQICEYGDGYNNAMVAMSKIAGEALKGEKDGGK